MADSDTPVLPRPAATVIILRDGGAGIEAFMVVRHHAIDFASGALVFPGGKVDAGDTDPAWAELAPSAGAGPDRSFVVAAARETFEEAGLVLARRKGADVMLGAAEAHSLVERHRTRLVGGESSFRDVIATEDLRLATELMVPFAHWITPAGVPKRFDTHFFLVAAPVDQLGAHDGGESVEGLWISPQQAIDEAAAGTRTLVFATLMNLRKLSRFASVADAVSATRKSRIVTVMPRVERTAEGRLMHIPEDAGYGVSQVLMPHNSAPMKAVQS